MEMSDGNSDKNPPDQQAKSASMPPTSGQEVTIPETQISHNLDDPGGVVLALQEHIPSAAETVQRLLMEKRDLEDQVTDLQKERDRLEEARQNTKESLKRQRRQSEVETNTALLEDLVSVRTNLARAQQQDGDLLEGVRLISEEFDSALKANGIDPISPSPGESLDPSRHEVISTQYSDQEEGKIVECYRQGYESEDRVLFAAQVVTSAGSQHQNTDD